MSLFFQHSLITRKKIVYDLQNWFNGKQHPKKARVHL